MKKIAVPEGMCGAAENMWMVCGDYPVDPERFRKHVLPVVRAALLWLSENPTTPNEDQLRDMQAEYKRQGYDGTGHGFVAEEWQRRMFLAPEQDDSRFAKVKTVLNRYFYMGNPQFDKFADEVVPHILSAIDTPDCSGCGELNGHKWDCPKLREKAEPPQDNDPDPEKARCREALEKLAKLGNGDAYGNSTGNTIAQEALGINRRATSTPEAPEDIAKLMFDKPRTDVWADEANHHIRWAYTLGQKSVNPTPPQVNGFDEKFNRLTVEVNRLGMESAIEILQRIS